MWDIVESCLKNLNDIIAGVFTVSGIIDAFLYHGHKQLKAKLGKNTWVDYIVELIVYFMLPLPQVNVRGL
jgi:hypothetical protein